MKHECQSCEELFNKITDDFGFVLCPDCAPDHYCVCYLTPSFDENEGDLCNTCLRECNEFIRKYSDSEEVSDAPPTCVVVLK